MGKREFKPGTMLNPVPVVMVTCGNKTINNIITIAWTGVVNSEPPMVYISVRKSRYSHDIIRESGEFAVNLVTEELAKATDFCGVRSGRDMDKFKDTGLTRFYGKHVECPMIAESPVNLECKVKDIKEYPSHDMFIAEVVNVYADESIIDEADRLRLDLAGLCCYNHGEYFGVKKHAIGKFGFSVMKPKTRRRINREKNSVRGVTKKR